MEKMMKHYLVTGGAGFLGSNLCRRLIKEGQRVSVIDNLETGSKRNIEDLMFDKNFQFFEHDIVEPIKIVEKIDYVLNLACPASPPKYFRDPIKTLETNSLGTKNMLDLALQHGARFFHTSTSEIYGDPKEHPQSESYFGNVQPYCKRSCYDEGKRYAEALIFQYRYEKGLNTGIVRIFNTYGPGMDPEDGRVVSNFINQALRGEDLTIQGDGNQTRSFCYVDDQVEGMMRIIHSKEEGPINIGNPSEFTINELADIVLRLTGSESKKIYIEAVLSDPKQRKPDITMAKTKLGWEPRISLEEGLKETIKWFEKIESRTKRKELVDVG
jgi:UDP-glucuronate decarboxylase